MIVMSFDLSSKCIGVVAAKIERKEVKKIKSCPIIPKGFDPSTLGFFKSKKKLQTKNGKLLNAYAKPGETTITAKEKQERDHLVRSQKDIFVLKEISNSMSNLIENINPDIILVEKNAIFNGILTSILLAKVMGVLLGLAGRMRIEVIEYSVSTVRKPYKSQSLAKEFVKNKSPEELKKIPDITKAALGDFMSKKYNIIFGTDDESDACVVFDYWYTSIFKKDVF